MTIDFCLPVYNEEKILAANLAYLRDFLIAQTWSFTWQITIIVNGSNDCSLAIAQDWADRYELLRVINLTKGGKGWAVREGFRNSPADILVFMDIDLAVSLENLVDLLQPLLLNQQDLVFGSRLLPRSETSRSMLRNLTSQLYNLISRLLLRHQFTDLQCGFKAMRREMFIKIDPALQDNQWFFDTELTILAQRQGYRLLEIPVNWQENRYQKRASKINPWRDGYRFIKKLIVFSWRLRSMRKR